MNKIVLLLTALVVYPQISETIYTPSLPDISHYFGVTTSWTGLTLSFYFFGFAVGVLFWGILCDQIGRRPSMLWGLSVYIAGTLACALSQNIIVLIVARFIQAFGASTGSIVTQTMLRDLYTGAERSRIFSRITAAIALSPAIGPLMGGYLDEWFGFRSNFTCLLLIGIALFIASKIQLPETRQTIRDPNFRRLLQLWKKMFLDKHVMSAVALIAICNGIMFGYYAEAPFIFIELLGFTPGQYGWLGILIAGSMMLSSWISHRINTNYGVWLMLIGSVVMSISAHYGVNTFGLMSSICLIFLGIGLILPGILSRALQHYQDVVGTAGALLGLMYYIVVGIMIEMVGFLHRENILPVTLYFVVLSGLACVLNRCQMRVHDK